ncbi:MAG TPA: hypothetical protein VMS56_16260 [Thermoanaerobaculia bacterium]|nr:hypothetical protein [Thermoanaerobaculia bacterium]
MRPATGFAVLLLCAALAVDAQGAGGDAAWERRPEGAEGGRAAAGPIDEAIAAYRADLAADPADLEARWKLVRALRFRGVYATATVDEKKTIFEEGKRIGGEGIAQLDEILASRGAGPVTKSREKSVAEALRDVPHAGELLYWDAVTWGEWALVFGKLAAARQGAADRIRRESTIVMLMDPSIENGGGARVLGRLHHQTPRVPFITGWASDAKAVEYLGESLEHGSGVTVTKVFLAEALVAADSGAKPRAIAILREVVAAGSDPTHTVEDAAAKADARALLADWGAK